MGFLRKFLDNQARHFEKGGKLEKLYPLYEMGDTFLYSPPDVTKGKTHVRDGLDLKRMMSMVVLALVPVVIWGIYNTGHQAHLAILAGAPALDTWQTGLYQAFGLGFEDTVLNGFLHGLCYYLPIFVVTFAVGGGVEATFSIIRKHEVNEGFLVTGFLFPLIVPATIPLWQVGLGIAFGVLIGKEVFGGTGMNVLNPALVGRAFLFFAYPGQISGDAVWTAAGTSVDGVSGATPLANAAVDSSFLGEFGGEQWMDAFLGNIPGSLGETSTLLCLVGAAVLIISQVGSWRTMLGIVVGTVATSYLLNAVGSDTNPMFAMPFWWHMVLGGWAFGAVFMATDPVSSAFSDKGKLYYGLGIGILAVLVRVVNPAYPEGMMLAILFMNMFAPLIDHFVVQANIKRRAARDAA